MNPPDGRHRAIRVAAIELAQEFGAVARSLARIDDALASLPPTDLALLPETIVTGYVSPTLECDLRPFAEEPGGPVATALSALAKKHRVALAGPVIERVGRRFYNALVLFDRDGEIIGRWHKRHPWVIEKWASPGALGSPVVDFMGLTLTAAICYDVHFLTRDASEALDASDVVLFPTAWVDDPHSDPDLRATLLGPIAKRHRTVIVNANWAPSRPRLDGQGASRIVGPDGLEIARSPVGSASAVVHAAVFKKA